MAYEVPVTQARAEFADLVNRVVYGGERVVVTRHGKPIVALVSADDLGRLAQLDRQEHELDRQEHEAAPGLAPVVRLTSDAGEGPGHVDKPAARFEVAAEHRQFDQPGAGHPGAGRRPPTR